MGGRARGAANLQPVALRVAFLLLLLALPLPAAARVYLTSFQCGEVVALDEGSGGVAWRLPVEDGAGIVGLCASPDGRRVYVVDGGASGRLRVVEAATGRVASTHRVEDRACMLGGPPVASLSGDGRWLYLRTYDYGAAAAGMRIFDVARGAMRPLGMRDRPCDTPLLAGAPGRRMFASCKGRLWLLREGTDGEYVADASALVAFESVAALAVGGDGQAWVLEFSAGDAPWRLAAWKPGGQARIVDLGKGLDARPDPRGGSAALGVSRDGRTVAVARGDRIWVLDAGEMRLLREVRLPELIDAVEVSGKTVLAFAGYTLYRYTADGRLEVVARGVLRGRGAPGMMAR